MNSELHTTPSVATKRPHARDGPESASDVAYSKAHVELSGLTQNLRGVVLWVSPLAEDHVALQRICAKTSWRTSDAYTCREALGRIAEEKPDVVLCEASLPDGDWKDLLAEVSRGLNPPCVIVTSRLADDSMWAEVLNLGAYDLLVKPFDPVEIYRVVGFACQRHQERQNARPKH